ncbi:MAG: HK97 family phage prohead protease [Cephaloticoccus sp.]
MQTKQLFVTVEKADPASGYDARFVMSAATPDRVKDTIDPVAYKSAARTEKLIALWQHDPEKPIGFWTNLKAEGDRLTGYIKLAGTNLAQMVKQLIDDGVPLSSSIGFRGKGEANDIGGIHFKSIELLECSIVSVPAHPRAVQIAKSFGLSSVIESEPEIAVSGITPNETLIKARAAILKANRAVRK